ncbi:hypothetical protein PG990_008355 [Apiospora arundinis]|uniref:SP-RING-type domain-containing protein n=1 Tax=Apiospora arundinis TaxID=335852 RepID=A0ABR2JN15_9PEZI
MAPPSRRLLSGSARQARSSATPSSTRQDRRSGPLELPEYEPPSCPLNAESRRKILDLASQQLSTKYNEQLTSTLKMLEDSVRDINDNYAARKHDLQTRQSKRREKGGGDDEEPTEQERVLKEAVRKLRDVVPELTASSEEAVRQVIDWQVEVEDEKAALREIQTLLEDEASAAQIHLEADNPEDDDDVPEVKGPRRFFTEARRAQNEEYTSKTMYQRYGMNNEYIHFKRLWHDAVHSKEEQAPPLPDATKWFGQDGDDAAEDSDEELIVAGEVQDFRCPLSMVVMKEPYTSKVCKHSFDKPAIYEYLPRNGMAKRCPLPGCDKDMKRSDLYFDDVLLRRINRATASQAGTQDDDGDEDEDEEEGSDEEGDVSMRVTAERDIKTERGRDRGRRLIEDMMNDD